MFETKNWQSWCFIFLIKKLRQVKYFMKISKNNNLKDFITFELVKIKFTNYFKLTFLFKKIKVMQTTENWICRATPLDAVE